jgi:hypothetical protein
MASAVNIAPQRQRPFALGILREGAGKRQRRRLVGPRRLCHLEDLKSRAAEFMQ